MHSIALQETNFGVSHYSPMQSEELSGESSIPAGQKHCSLPSTTAHSWEQLPAPPTHKTLAVAQLIFCCNNMSIHTMYLLLYTNDNLTVPKNICCTNAVYTKACPPICVKSKSILATAGEGPLCVGTILLAVIGSCTLINVCRKCVSK